MLSDNIRKYRKENNMSQDELAEKLGVSRQSISLWETGQTQPTIDNIIALSKVFNVSTDAILGNAVDHTEAKAVPEEKTKRAKKPNLAVIGIISAAVIVCVAVVIALVMSRKSTDHGGTDTDAGSTGITLTDATETEPTRSETTGIITPAEETEDTDNAATEPDTEKPETEEDTTQSVSETDAAETKPAETTAAVSTAKETDSPATEAPETKAPETKAPETKAPETTAAATAEETTEAPTPFDLFAYCRDFAIEKGVLNGDYCIYQQPAALYGGYDNEYFSISYWGDSNMVEFCLHCPLDDTFSINFYLRMRGGYDGMYEYSSSRYYRTDGTSLRSAYGYIDPSVFSDSYPLRCDRYDGSAVGQTEFMEESRIGMCDLIRCLKQFVRKENMECGFEEFGFVKF